MKGNYFQKSSEKLAVIYYEGKPTFQKLYNPFFKAVVSLANTYGGKIILLKKIVGKGESKTKYVPIPHFHLRECEEVLVHDIMPYIGSIMNHNPITEYKKIPLDEKQQEYRIEINVENYIDGLLAYEDKNHRKTEYYRDSEGHIFPISSQGKTKDLEIKIITNKIKQNSLQKVGIHDYNLINADEPITSAYKYMTLDVFLSCLKYGTIRMQEPTNWKDQYEGRFYNAKYDNITNSNLPRLYATCITANPASEAAWKVYAHGTGLGARCVQIKINMEKLRKQLCNGQNGTYYEGKVFYDLTDSEIDHLHETGAHYHSLFSQISTLICS